MDTELARNRLKILMEQKGLTTRKMAERLGVSKSIVNYWLSGKRPLSKKSCDHIIREFAICADWMYGPVSDDEHTRERMLCESISFCRAVKTDTKWTLEEDRSPNSFIMLPFLHHGFSMKAINSPNQVDRFSIKINDIVIIDTNKTAANTEEAFLLSVDGYEPVFCYIKNNPTGDFVITSGDEEIPPMLIEKQQLDDRVQILGRLICAIKTFL